MSKHRAITGFGPTVIKSSNKTSTSATTVVSTWFRWGPATAKQLALQAIFSGSTAGQSVKVEAMFTTLSTAAGRFRTIATIKSSQAGFVMGTSSGPFAMVRTNSTKIKAGGNVQTVLLAVN